MMTHWRGDAEDEAARNAEAGGQTLAQEIAEDLFCLAPAFALMGYLSKGVKWGIEGGRPRSKDLPEVHGMCPVSEGYFAGEGASPCPPAERDWLAEEVERGGRGAVWRYGVWRRGSR